MPDQPAWSEWTASVPGLAAMLLRLDTASVKAMPTIADALGPRPVTQLLRTAFAAGYEAGRKDKE